MPEKNIVVTSGIPMTPVTDYRPQEFGIGSGASSPFNPGMAQETIKFIQRRREYIYRYYPAVLDQAVKTQELAYSEKRQAIPENVGKTTITIDSKGSSLDSIKQEISNKEKKVAQKTIELQSQKAIANRFYKGDFFSRKVYAFTSLAVALEVSNDSSAEEAYEKWQESLQAAYKAKLINDEIEFLNEQIIWMRGQATVAAEAETKRIAAEVEAQKAANTFRAQGSVAATQPLFVISSGVIAVAEATATLLAAAIRSAIVGLTSAIVGSASAVAVGVFSLLAFPSKLGNGEMPERYSFSTPLSDLAPNLGLQELQAAAAVGGTVDMPVRISSKTAEDGRSEVFVVKTDGVTIPSKVKVIAATYNAGQNVYTATTADVPPRTLTWTPIVSPGNSSTTSPTQQPLPPAYTGATVTPVQGRIDTFPAVAEASFDDYIMILPVGTGFVPVYMMFRDRREDPGVATGVGQPVSGVWLGAASQGEGAPIPSQIADQLRGREFKSFREFREALWKAVANDPILSKQFKAVNLGRMKKGYAPYAVPSEQVGGKVKFELHHVIFLKNNGALYDIDNIHVVTPKEHTALHK